jgi:hypothetical protein
MIMGNQFYLISMYFMILHTFLATIPERENIVKILLNNKQIEINKQNNDGLTALFWVLEKNALFLFN